MGEHDGSVPALSAGSSHSQSLHTIERSDRFFLLPYVQRLDPDTRTSASGRFQRELPDGGDGRHRARLPLAKSWVAHGFCGGCESHTLSIPRISGFYRTVPAGGIFAWTTHPDTSRIKVTFC